MLCFFLVDVCVDGGRVVDWRVSLSIYTCMDIHLYTFTLYPYMCIRIFTYKHKHTTYIHKSVPSIAYPAKIFRLLQHVPQELSHRFLRPLLVLLVVVLLLLFGLGGWKSVRELSSCSLYTTSTLSPETIQSTERRAYTNKHYTHPHISHTSFPPPPPPPRNARRIRGPSHTSTLPPRPAMAALAASCFFFVFFLKKDEVGCVFLGGV